VHSPAALSTCGDGHVLIGTHLPSCNWVPSGQEQMPAALIVIGAGQEHAAGFVTVVHELLFPELLSA
jgi:hypothetical protein